MERKEKNSTLERIASGIVYKIFKQVVTDDAFDFFVDKINKFYKETANTNNKGELFAHLKSLNVSNSECKSKLLPDFLELSLFLDEYDEYEEYDGDTKDYPREEVFLDFQDILVDCLASKCNFKTYKYSFLYEILLILEKVKFDVSDFVDIVEHKPNHQRLELINCIFITFSSKKECIKFLGKLDNMELDNLD